MGNNAGKWDKHYADLKSPDHYIDTETYEAGAEWLRTCKVVEDWGCGKGWFEYVVGDRFKVVGVDGSKTPFASKIVDLEDYTTSVEGIYMRGVAEHNFNWDKILKNLFASFTDKACIVFFTPMSDTDEAKVLALAPGYDNIPDISIPESFVVNLCKEKGLPYCVEVIESKTAYSIETIFYIGEPDDDDLVSVLMKSLSGIKIRQRDISDKIVRTRPQVMPEQ
jgi:hypothetical protein